MRRISRRRSLPVILQFVKPFGNTDLRARLRLALVLLMWVGNTALGSTGQEVQQELNVAVAANFFKPMERLGQTFEQQTGVKITVSSGSTGALFAQIQNGAPFDAFFAADVARPLRLEEEGQVVAGSRFTYAIGKLALWSTQEGFVDDQGDVLRTGKFQHLAMANPSTAPYGLATREVLQNLGLWASLQGKIVRGENVAQTFQFVATGNAELGFVAWSDLSQPDVPTKSIAGSFWVVPQALYNPIKQQAVLLSASPKQALGEQFLDFMRSSEARQRILKFGYDLP